MASSANDWSDLPASYDVTHTDQISGAANAIIGFEATGRQQEAERILAMNPDFVFVTGESVDDFLQDRRWQGLKAVVSKHVYRGGNEFSPCSPTWHLDEDALQARLKAEILHPDRLQPRVRECGPM
jgi:ABC-type Fe3+-hydroxamate transport system substrate-binding protein